MSDTAVHAASQRRLDLLLDDEVGKRIDLLLANFESVQANPRTMSHLKPLLAHYAKSEHPFGDCVKDNLKRFGPGRTEKVCAVLKDTLRGTTSWREGHHSDESFAEMPAEIFEFIERLGEECDVYRVIVGLDDAPTFSMEAATT